MKKTNPIMNGGLFFMFIPKAIYYEEKVKEYPFGRELLDKYEKMNRCV